MNKTIIPLAMAATLMGALGSCSNQEQTLIDKPEFKAESRIFDITALEALGRVSGPAVSPDGKKVLYSVSYESVELNKSNNELYVMNVDGTDVHRLTRTPQSESQAVWINGG